MEAQHPNSKSTTDDPYYADEDGLSGEELEAAITAGWHSLSKSPFDLRLAFLGMNLKGRRLRSLAPLRCDARFQHIQHLDVSDNGLTSLSPSLDALPHLTELDASKNHLKEALDFCPPRCSAERAWNAGDQWVGSSLTEANLSHNSITSLHASCLTAHPYLRRLYLSFNHINSLPAPQDWHSAAAAEHTHTRASNHHHTRTHTYTHTPPMASQKHTHSPLAFLTHLDLAYNQLHTLSGVCVLRSLTHLCVAHNALTSLDGLDGLTHLETLDVSENQIASLRGIRNQTVLKRLDASSNRIEAMAEIDHLAPLTYLLDLRIDGNALVELEHYRARVLVRLQCVALLDGVDVSAEEKVKAINLHAAEGGDRKNRQAEWSRHFPDRPFVDTLPPFVGGEDAGRAVEGVVV